MLSLIMSYLRPLMKHSAGNVISGRRYDIIRDNIQRAMSSVDEGMTLLEITFSGQCHQWTKALIMLYLCPLMKHSAGNVISGQRYDIIRDHCPLNVIITLLEITFSGKCHQWTKALIMLYLCPLMKHSAGNVICGQRYKIIRDHCPLNVIITLLEITFSGKCHQWTKV